MSFNLKSLSALIILSAVSLSASADGYVGIKAGIMSIDLGGIDDPINGGIMFGSNKGAGWGLEGEITTSMVKGEVFGVDVTITTMAGYAAYRSEGDSYLKARLGVLKEDVEIGSVSGDDSGASYGLGVGWRQSDGSMVELEFTIVEQDVNFLSLGASF
jgi:hypothetical protein